MANLISDIERLYAEAQGRWVGVDWPLEAYRDHLGDESPRHPVDMYLGGAAGCRLDSAWTCMQEKLAPQVLSMLARKPRADMTVEDIWSETLVNMLKDDTKRPPLPDNRRPAMIIRYRGMAALVSYLVTAGVRVAISRNRTRRETPVSFSAGDDDGQNATLQMAPDESTPDGNVADREQAGLFAVRLREALEALDSEDHFILTAVFRDGIRQKRVAEMLGLRDYHVTRRIQAAAAAVRKHMEHLADETWNEQLSAAWESVWAEFCRSGNSGNNSAQDSPASASDSSGA